MIGEKLAALIEDNDKTMYEVAAALNVNVRTLNRWKNNKSDIPSEKLTEICRYFGVSADELLELS